MDFADRTLVCTDCGLDFVFTAGEQIFFHEKAFKNDPKRCKHCKTQRSGNAVSDDGVMAGRGGAARTETRTVCSACGVETTVPFKPTQGRPVLCRSCFQVAPPRPYRSLPVQGEARPGMQPADPQAGLRPCDLGESGV